MNCVKCNANRKATSRNQSMSDIDMHRTMLLQSVFSPFVIDDSSGFPVNFNRSFQPDSNSVVMG